MRKNFILLSLMIIGLLISGSLVYAQNKDGGGTSSSGRKFSGGLITVEPAQSYSKEKQTCESGGTCNGTCSNTWTDASKIECGKKTFTLNVYSPKGSATEYCIPESAKGNGNISSGKLIINAHTQAQSTIIGDCTCISGDECEITTVETVSVDLAHITAFGTN